jgi:lysophospholipase L1-like esterase
MFASIRGGSCAQVTALLLALALPAVTPVAAARGAEPAAKGVADPLEMIATAKRICVLGDSITYDGRWVSALSAWMEAKGLTGDVIAVGLPSETCSGLSEEGHAGGQFPRPDVHERLARVLWW